MSDQLVTIAAFDSPIEAHLVRGLLEAEGIRVVLNGEHATTLFAGVSSAFASISLLIPASDLARADALLDQYEKGDEEEPAASEDMAGEVWVCSLCGDGVPLEANVCPSCQTPRDAVREDIGPDSVLRSRRSGMVRKMTDGGQAVQRRDETTDRPLRPELAGHEAEADLPDVATFLGDDIARRAFLAAVFGLLAAAGALISFLVLAGLPFFAYSAWCLLKLMTYSGELSPSGMRHFYAALVLNAVSALFVLGVVGSILARVL